MITNFTVGDLFYDSVKRAIAINYMWGLNAFLSKRGAGKNFLNKLSPSSNTSCEEVFLVVVFVFYLGSLSETQTKHKTSGEGREPSVFFYVTFSCPETFQHLFAVLQLRWLPRFFNRSASHHQAVTRWDLSISGN